MDKLTLRTRTVIELRELGELSTREAAEIMGLSVGSVKARVFQGAEEIAPSIEMRMHSDPSQQTMGEPSLSIDQQRARYT
jgi:DNA-directed RNA polymerase specialized sigma24 family protein